MSDLISIGPEAAPALAEVHATAFERPWSAADLASLMDSPGVAAIAVGAQTRLDGFILVRSIAGEAEILTLAVRPEAQRGGIGHALVEAGAAAAAGAGAEAMWLEVAADNAPALALYGRTGFEAAGRRPAYYARRDGPAVDAVLLRRTLNPARS